jgi:hypothetical protein
MASNEVEVLDPAATVEKLKKIVPGVVLNRRHFMAALGAAGVAAGTGLVSEPAARAQAVSPPGFSQIDVINLLLLVKYVTATYISFVTQGADLPGPTATSVGSGVTYGTGQIYNQPAKVTFSGTNAAQITDMFNEMYYDEVNSLVALRNLLINQYPAGTPVGETAVCPRPTMNLAGTSAANATFSAPSGTMTQSGPQVIAQARMLKDLSVTAFTSALQYLSNGPTATNPNNGATLATVAQILAVEGFHSAALRLATIQTGAPFQSTEYVTTFQIGTQAGSTTVYAVSTLPSSVAVGQPLSGTGIPAGAIITALSSTSNATPTGVVIKGSTLITGMSSLSGLLAGQPITGTNIPALTYVTAIGTNTITISQAPSGTVSPVAPTGYLTAGTSTVTGASSVSGLIVGQPITGPSISFTGIATSGSAILASVSSPAGLTVGQPISGTAQFAAMTTSGSNLLTSVFILTGTAVAVGQPISGTGIPSGTTITAINASAQTITMSANATATSTAGVTVTATVIPSGATIAAVNSTAPYTVTMSASALASSATSVTATIIPAGATVSAASGSTITMSTAALGSTVVNAIGVVTNNSTTITSLSSTSGLNTGQVISGAGIPSGATIKTITGQTLNLSSAAKATTPIQTVATFTGIVTNASSVITQVSSTTGLSGGQVLSGANIPAGTTTILTVNNLTITLSANATATAAAPETVTINGTAFTALTTNNSTLLTSLSSLTGVAVGQTVTGTGIPSGTTVAAINGLTVTMSANATATVSSAESISAQQYISQFQGVVVLDSPIITQVQAVSGTLVPGQPLNGTGIAVGTTIAATNGLAVTLSAAAIATNTGNVTINGTTVTGTVTNGSTLLSSLSSLTGPALGQTVSGTGIPSGTTIVAITITMSAPAAASSTVSTTANTFLGSTTLNTVYSLGGLIVGQPITGAFIPSGTTIVSFSGSILNMSQAALGNTGTAVETITSFALETILAGGEVLFANTTGTVNVPAAQALAIGKSTTTISVPAVLSASSTAIIVTPDPFDVAPVDPGTAAAAALGPAANPSSSPTLYQGFFDTAATGNATANTPPGFAYARTFSQVLAVLFANNTPGTYDGGFYPVSLSSYGYVISSV